MARPPAISKDKILNAAHELFTRYGYSKTTINDIANELYIGKSSLYYYFKDKDELFAMVLDRDISRIKYKITGILASASLPHEKLKAYILFRMKSVKEFINVYTAFKDEYISHYAFVHKIREGYDAYEISLIKSFLVEGVARGIFSIADVGLTGATIFSAIKGLEYEWATKVDARTIEKNVSALFDILLHGIMKRQP